MRSGLSLTACERIWSRRRLTHVVKKSFVSSGQFRAELHIRTKFGPAMGFVMLHFKHENLSLRMCSQQWRHGFAGDSPLSVISPHLKVEGNHSSELSAAG